jgi:putative FmdB family regulatory protein
MPLYEYDCSACGAEFELLIRGDARATCRSCGSDNVVRRLSHFSVTTLGGSQSRLRRAKTDYAASQKERLIAEREERERHHH